MNSKVLAFVAIAIFLVSQVHCQSPAQPEPRSAPHVQSVQPQQPHSSGEQAPSTTNNNNQYGFRSNQPATTSGHNYPGYGSYTRDTYGSGRDAAGNPLFGVSSNADFQLSAYFGQIFWGFVAVVITLALSIWVIRLITGTDVVGGFVDKISNANGKSLDLDRLTNMVYEAVDTVGKFAVKEARHLESLKGR